MTIYELIARVERAAQRSIREDVVERAAVTALDRLASAVWQREDGPRLIKTYAAVAITAGKASLDQAIIAESIPILGEILHSSYVFALEQLMHLNESKLSRNAEFGYYVLLDDGVYPVDYLGAALTGTLTIRAAYTPTLAELPSAFDEELVDEVLRAIGSEEE